MKPRYQIVIHLLHDEKICGEQDRNIYQNDSTKETKVSVGYHDVTAFSGVFRSNHPTASYSLSCVRFILTVKGLINSLEMQNAPAKETNDTLELNEVEIDLL